MKSKEALEKIKKYEIINAIDKFYCPEYICFEEALDVEELLNVIEKDLEVLEIIRNHSEIKNIWSVAGKGPEYFDTTIHQSIDKEDFKKVKEWYNGSKPNKQ